MPSVSFFMGDLGVDGADCMFQSWIYVVRSRPTFVSWVVPFITFPVTRTRVSRFENDVFVAVWVFVPGWRIFQFFFWTIQKNTTWRNGYQKGWGLERTRIFHFECVVIFFVWQNVFAWKVEMASSTWIEFIHDPPIRLSTCYYRWWLQIFLFFIFTPIWGNDPFWLIFFKWVETTN